jgi:hypothetical protein
MIISGMSRRMATARSQDLEFQIDKDVGSSVYVATRHGNRRVSEETRAML